MGTATLSSYVGGQNVALMRSGMGRASQNSTLVTMLASCNGPHGGFPVARASGGLEDAIARCGQKRSFYAATCEGGAALEDPEVEDADDLESGEGGLSPRVEKKRRLSFEQVRSLERNFEKENKLEPERKMQLASELGLQPRQVAVWFQNRRARWKTKQLERDYEMLNSGYLKLKAEFESTLLEKAALQAEVERLSGKASPVHDTQSVDSTPCKSELADCTPPTEPPSSKCAATVPTIEVAKEVDSTGDSSSELLDADSPRTTGSNHLDLSQLQDDLACGDFAPVESFVGPEDAFPPVKLEDDAAFQVDPTCSYFLPPIVERGMLPWWDWA